MRVMTTTATGLPRVALSGMRASRNMTIRGLSDASGVSEATILRIEADERRDAAAYDPRLSRVVRIASALGCQIDELVHEHQGERTP